MFRGIYAPLGRFDYDIHARRICSGGGSCGVLSCRRQNIHVNHYSVVYEKDLGPDSLKIVKDMQLFNPQNLVTDQ
ncbi:MAG TPA: DUF2950 family protein [Candidatus Angelobacter sp.]|nr:DUF2950 family protein [Candidatus Angelobacter sp.]